MNTPRTVMPNAEHVALSNAMKDSIKGYEHMDPYEILAVAAQFVGNLVAMQDSTAHTPESVMETIQRNIETGNRTAIEALTPKGSA